MSNPISLLTSVTPATPVQPAEKAAAANPKAAVAKTTQTPTDTVQISTAGQTAAQEARETPAQTQQEAAKGDSQAKSLLAREAAAAYVPKK